jgi:hypothetical protein
MSMTAGRERHIDNELEWRKPELCLRVLSQPVAGLLRAVRNIGDVLPRWPPTRTAAPRIRAVFRRNYQLFYIASHAVHGVTVNTGAGGCGLLQRACREAGRKVERRVGFFNYCSAVKLDVCFAAARQRFRIARQGVQRGRVCFMRGG